MSNVKGNHPYADAFPMASAEELEELAASIAAVGLIHPIVLTPEGEVLDGRNRLAACEKAGVEPVFETREGDDDDYKEFVIGANTTGRRESMTAQIAAASTALILGGEKRVNGQWRRGALGRNPDLKTPQMKEPLAQAGFVLDVLGTEALEEVRDGNATLNAVYEKAREVKEAREAEERARVEEARNEQQREDHAGRYFDKHPEAQAWLDSKPQGSFETMRGAYAAYLEHDREARRAEQEEKRKKEEEQREHRVFIERHKTYVETFVKSFKFGLMMMNFPARDEVLDAMDKQDRDRFLEIENKYLKGRD